ncbi:MAG: U32 family peptidase [Solobacterium sp.]|nr:U32 family peptidase [Solobacterium sp.]
MKKIELLAPAGNPEALKAAVSAGCDAVYLGLTSFSARAFAGNFTHEQYLEAIRYCHIRDVSIYVTINTLMFEQEIDTAMEEIRFLYENDVDGIMIQDLGLFHKARLCFPDLPLFCSTQMHIHNADGAAFMKAQGASRIVAARETPLSVLKEMVSTGIDVEAFAYGAQCISYSGQCLMSQAMKNRSGNRGMCAQMCRMKYWTDGGKNTDGDYLLSPRDLNLIDRVPELIEAGICSLKIEGRMKRPEYVWLVVRTFREAIEACYRNETYTVSRERLKELKLMFNRDFTEGHIFGADTASRMNHYRPNHLGVQAGTVVSSRKGKVQVRLSDVLHQHDGLRIIQEPADIGLTAVRIERNGKLVSRAEPGDTVWLDCPQDEWPKKGSPLHKTSDTELLSRIREGMQEEHTVPVAMEYSAEPGAPLIVTVDDGIHSVSALSEQNCEYAQKAPLSAERLAQALRKAGGKPYIAERINGHCGNVFLPVSVINDTRRRALAMLDEQRAVHHSYCGEQTAADTLPEPEKPSYRLIVAGAGDEYRDGILFAEKAFLPPVRENGYDSGALSDCIVSEPGALNHPLSHCIAGMNLNAANSWACAFLLRIPGIDGIILSSEVLEGSVQRMIRAFKERYGFVPALYLPVYGRRTLMYIKNGFTADQDNVHSLKDLNKEVYPTVTHDHVTEILEPEPLHRKNEHCWGSYVMITDENERTIKRTVEEAYEEVYERI